MLSSLRASDTHKGLKSSKGNRGELGFTPDSHLTHTKFDYFLLFEIMFRRTDPPPISLEPLFNFFINLGARSGGCRSKIGWGGRMDRFTFRQIDVRNVVDLVVASKTSVYGRTRRVRHLISDGCSGIGQLGRAQYIFVA